MKEIIFIIWVIFILGCIIYNIKDSFKNKKEMKELQKRIAISDEINRMIYTKDFLPCLDIDKAKFYYDSRKSTTLCEEGLIILREKRQRWKRLKEFDKSVTEIEFNLLQK